MNGREFVILSDNGLLRAGTTTRQSLDKLKANGVEEVNYSDDLLNALSNDENALFLPKDAQEIESLYDVTSAFSIGYFTKEAILKAYAKTKQLINSA